MSVVQQGVKMPFGSVEKVCFDGIPFNSVYSLLPSMPKDSLFKGKEEGKGTTFH